MFIHVLDDVLERTHNVQTEQEGVHFRAASKSGLYPYRFKSRILIYRQTGQIRLLCQMLTVSEHEKREV